MNRFRLGMRRRRAIESGKSAGNSDANLLAQLKMTIDTSIDQYQLLFPSRQPGKKTREREREVSRMCVTSSRQIYLTCNSSNLLPTQDWFSLMIISRAMVSSLLSSLLDHLHPGLKSLANCSSLRSFDAFVWDRVRKSHFFHGKKGVSRCITVHTLVQDFTEYVELIFLSCNSARMKRTERDDTASWLFRQIVEGFIDCLFSIDIENI